jgi:hypothetical protein
LLEEVEESAVSGLTSLFETARNTLQSKYDEYHGIGQPSGEPARELRVKVSTGFAANSAANSIDESNEEELDADEKKLAADYWKASGSYSFPMTDLLKTAIVHMERKMSQGSLR